MAVSLNGDGTITGLSTLDSVTITGLTSLTTTDLTADTTTLVVDSANNLVGVGTNSPNDITGTGLRQLVVGNNSGNNGVIVNSSSSGDSAYSFAVNNVKLGRVGYDYLNNMTFQTNNAERMRINSSGNVGIGTSSPSAKLDVAGAVTIQGNNGAGTLNTLQFKDTDTATASGQDIGAIEFYSADASNAGVQAYIKGQADGSSGVGRLTFGTGTGASVTERMRITSSGNVGIGTTSQANKLEVSGAIVSQDAVDSYTNDGLYLSNEGSGIFQIGAWRSGANASILTFGTDSGSDAAPVEAMRIDSSGRVGIKTSSPVATLDVVGSFNITGRIRNTTGGSAAAPSIQPGNDGDTGMFWAASNTLGFSTTSTERMRIDSSGRVGIGTSSPSYKFDVAENATTFAARIFNDGNTDTRRGLIITCGSDTGAGTNTSILFQDGNATAVGSITFSGGTVSYGTFTAWHPCVLPEGDTEYPYGTLLEIVSTYNYEKEGADYKQAIRYNVQKTQAENSKAVLGVYAGSLKDVYEDEPNLHQAYVLGDGHILCNNSGGDIKIGDGICSSSVAGIGKKATINPSMIIGIAQENVTFSNSEETKLVAVQYGLQQFMPWVD